VSKNFADPRLQTDAWSLDLSGLIKSPRRFSYDEVTALPSVEQLVTLECISNPVGGELMGNARWPGEHVLVARAVDGTGALQTAEERPQLPDGAAGHHRVRLHVIEPTGELSVLRR